MLKKPLLIRLLAVFLILDPLLRLLLLSIEKDFPLKTVFLKTIQLMPLDFFNYWFIFPLTGVLLLSIRGYSYVLYFVLQGYSLYFHVNYSAFSWPYLSEIPHISSLFLLGVNLLFVLYMLLPIARAPFFDENLRWWERGSRYSIVTPACTYYDNRLLQSTILDISYSGALLEISEDLLAGKPIVVDFDLFNKKYQVKATVSRRLERSKPTYGVRFLFNSFYEKFKMKLLIFSIAKTSSFPKYRD